MPPKRNHKPPICFSRYLEKGSNRVGAVLQQAQALSFRATQDDKLAANSLASVKLPCIRVRLCAYGARRLIQDGPVPFAQVSHGRLAQTLGR